MNTSFTSILSLAPTVRRLPAGVSTYYFINVETLSRERTRRINQLRKNFIFVLSQKKVIVQKYKNQRKNKFLKTRNEQVLLETNGIL